MPTLIVLFACTALAQDRGQFAGVIRDSSGAVLVDVTVSARDEETGIRRTARSNGEGLYAITSLAPGLYKITARKVGFRTVARLNVPVAAGQSARVDFVLPLGSIREVVTVEGGVPLTNTEDGSVGTGVGKSLIDALPLNGRGILGLVELSPGVVATPASSGEAGQFTANGQRANTNYFTVDGLSANSGVSGSSVPAQFAGGSLPGMTAFGGTQNLVTVEALQELRILTSSFAPEFGRMPGAQVALTTRSGSDEYHGALFYAFRNERLNANDRIAAAHGLPRAPHRLNHWGVSAGGPVRRDRTFFHASYEGMRLAQPYVWRTVTPSLAARGAAPAELRPLLDAFPLPNGPELGGHTAELIAAHSRPARLDAGSLRIDHALSARWNLFGRYNQAPSATRFGYSQVDSSEFRSRSVTVGAATLISPNASNDVRLNVARASVAAEWAPGAAGGARPVDLSAYLPPAGGFTTALRGVAIGGLGQLLAGQSGRNHQGQLELVEAFSLTRGPHSFRLGADYQRLTPTRETSALSIAGSYANLDALLAGTPMVTRYAQAEQAGSLIETLSLFAQDTWKATPRLTLTYGLRWELTPAPAMRQPVTPLSAVGVIVSTPAGPLPALPLAPAATPLWPTRYNQFAPRIGAAYRTRVGSILRAGWGLFYDLGFSAATDPINGFPYNRWQFSSGGVTPTLAAGSERSGYSLGAGLRIPHTRHWNFALEHPFTAADVVTVSYVGSSSRNLLRREGTRDPQNGVAQFAVATNHGASDYHGLQLQYRRRMTRGLQSMVSYTWSHAIDNGSWDSALALAEPGFEAARDRGSSAFDVRHAFTAAAGYTLPRLNWSLHAMLRARTGFPIDVLATENLLGLGFDNAIRPDLNAGAPVWLPGGRLNPAAFTVPEGGRQGNLGRNAITGFGMSQLDLALTRPFAWGELRLEAFNSLNGASPADPVRYLRHPLFGQPASMLNLMLGSGTPHSGLTPAFQVGGPRAIQATLRFRF